MNDNNLNDNKRSDNKFDDTTINGGNFEENQFDDTSGDEKDVFDSVSSSLAQQINQTYNEQGEYETTDSFSNSSSKQFESLNYEEDATKLPKKKGKVPKWAKVLSIICVVVLVTSISGMYAVSKYLDRINYSDWSNTQKLPEEFDQDDVEGLEEINPNQVILNSDGTIRKDSDVINILLVGVEAMNDSGRGRSDSMMIATMNKKQKKLKLTSIMRDLYVAIPGYSDNKLNSAYHSGGMPLLKDTIETNFNIELDGSVLVSYDSFEKIVDRLGGVEITLSASEASYLNRTNYISNPEYRHVVEGTQILNGNQALGYSRIRYVRGEKESDDFGRTNRQRTVLNAIFEKYKSKSLPEILSILYDLLDLVTTDIDKATIINYAKDLVSLGTTQLDMYRIPIDDGYMNGSVRGMSVLLPDTLQDNIKALQDFIFGPQQEEENLNAQDQGSEGNDSQNEDLENQDTNVQTQP